MRMKLTLCLCINLLSLIAFSQSNTVAYKFGDISAKDFQQKVYSIDSNAQAVILYDAGSAAYKSDNDSWFDVEYIYTKRIRLLNKNAFDLATIEIPLFKGEKKPDRIDKLEAFTYNIENGVVRKTKLDKECLYHEGQFDQRVAKERKICRSLP